MITAAIHSVPVARPSRPYSTEQSVELTRIVSEITERIEEMNELKVESGTDLVIRLAMIAARNRSAFALVIAVLHGRVEKLTDSYATRGDQSGLTKQAIHYRVKHELAHLDDVAPEAAHVIRELIAGIRRHEEPLSKAQALASACDNCYMGE